MMLVVFKAAPILKRTLKVRHALMQLYVLKLLKMQTKYLGRQWRKTNMKIISAIYEKVRHRLNDDWAFGNGMKLIPFSVIISRYDCHKILKLKLFVVFSISRFGRSAMGFPNGRMHTAVMCGSFQ